MLITHTSRSCPVGISSSSPSSVFHFSAVKEKKQSITKADRVKELLDEFCPSFATLVGDRIHDIEAARHHGIDSIGVNNVSRASE
jgi:phosphoglycolate phosphatase-like HAD superfamily hydrolase